MRAKKAMALLLTAAMTAGMTACGNSSSDSAPATTAPAATENTQQDKTADAAAAVQPLGPADASAALPTVASKFSTANATDAEFSTTSSSNDVSCS